MCTKRFFQFTLLMVVFLANLAYIIWRIGFTLPSGAGAISLFFAVGLLLAEVLGLLELCVTLDGIHHQYVPDLPDVSPVDFPAVDVFVATYNEDVSLVRRTLAGCKAMEYPDKAKVQIYLCDDGKREEMRMLAAQMGVHYLARTGNKGAKAGNLNHALTHSNAPLVATFDADMIPTPQFLLETVPYFCVGAAQLTPPARERKGSSKFVAFRTFFLRHRQNKGRKSAQLNGEIGFIQTPQSFYNPDLFQLHFFAQQRIPNEQDYFYRKVQLTKNHSNTVIYGGSNTVISRKALAEVGGFYEASITEDFATGILIQSKGYQCYAIPTVLATGLSPSDLKSLLAQRARWARGCIQTIQQLKIYRLKGLRLRQKLIYYSAISYWYSCVKRFFYLSAPIAFAAFGVQVVDCSLQEVLVLFLPTYLLTNAVLAAYSAGLRATHWTNVYETIFFPSLLGAVLSESIGRRQKRFSVTDKSGAVLRDVAYQRRKARVFYGYLSLSVFGICNLLFFTEQGGQAAAQGFVVLCWLVVNFLYLLMALFFVRGVQTKAGAEALSAPDAQTACVYCDSNLTGQNHAAGGGKLRVGSMAGDCPACGAPSSHLPLAQTMAGHSGLLQEVARSITIRTRLHFKRRKDKRNAKKAGSGSIVDEISVLAQSQANQNECLMSSATR